MLYHDRIRVRTSIRRSCSSRRSDMASQVAAVVPRYSASVPDKAIASYILLLHATIVLPRENMNPDVDRRFDVSPAQSASVLPTN